MEKDTKKTIAKSAGIIGIATLCSRILGFIRDLVIARLFGVYLYAQAFVIAFKIPNLFRDLVGEGAANAAFVPVFSEYLANDKKKEFWELANVLMNVMMVVLSLVTVLGIIFSPFLVSIVAPGFVSDTVKFTTTVQLNRIIFPYILLIGLTAYSMAILNSLRHFVVPAFAPCLLNISIIGFSIIFGEDIKGLALGVLVGGVLQLAVQIPILYKKGFTFSFNLDFKHPAVKQVGSLMAPRVLSSAIYQVNNFVDSIFGSLAWIVGDGAVAALYFSYRLIQFPIGIFSSSLAQAILPTLSCQVAKDDKVKLKETLNFGLRSIIFIMLPFAVLFMVLSKTIIVSLFSGGKFDVYSINATSQALFFYSIGLFAYASTRILQCGFFAIKDTVSPTKIAGLNLGLNIVFNSILMFPMKLSGIALANSLSGIICFIVLLKTLDKKIGGIDIKGLVKFFFKVLFASVIMGMVCFLVSKISFNFSNSILNRVLNLLLPVVCAAVSYIILAFVLKIEQIKSIWHWILKK